jgi:hypothetical protein
MGKEKEIGILEINIFLIKSNFFLFWLTMSLTLFFKKFK